MARVVHDTAALLDAAVGLLVSGSVADITMAGLIRAAGVSSGSVYHRFPDRAALLGAVWNRAVEGYHAGAYALFDGDPRTAATQLARYTVAWCAANPGEAQVLLAGPTAFLPLEWPAALQQSREAEQARWDTHLRHLLRDLRTTTGRDMAELLLLVVDLPYAAVRRYLSTRSTIPADLPATVAGILDASLAPDRHRRNGARGSADRGGAGRGKA
ncbi:TetR/AcrR family transcriptional regulator [Kutzneria sp. CA-103260]|uniref:TetR/AcrR family transcriptional regulator n=1 Tax=Kutzneria sp. CA-103260 TaxID=2802641 RepID=UPI001BA9974D|nr:TetR/AcrR family transcriptional regulator [Kutzneria sp. CA-103260]QUQ64331.1 Bacterial regulatory protein, tetR family [Kutzneria sp. CA-103260]